MRLDAHYGMLPERAFEKRGFGHTRPSTLEGGGKGGGGGGGAPTQSTVYQTNIPEYAKPYVTSMLGATARQLFEGTEKPSGEYEITGFRQYQPYSTDPTKYFAGPSSLQRGVYNEAGQMQTPGQFGSATGLAGAAGMGQLGTAQQAGTLGGLGTALGAAGAMQAMPAFQAGQQFMQGVTDPSRVGQFMSPYQQQVTDIAKAAAIRDAQMMEQGNRLAAARQGTYGGARQALASLERERNLGTNLANIQAQGSQAAYDKALQQMQFGSNLGLQGIQTGLQGVQAGMQGIGQGLQGVGAQQAGFAGAGQAAATLGGLGTQEQQADLARMGFQQQIGKAQQDYQQNIINQAVQDYATAQQYPLMQLGFMSNMLRGLPLQATSTQSYMAQPSLGQQALGLAGAYGAYKGMFKEGGEVRGLGYANRGQVDSMRDRLEEMFATDPEETAKYVAQSSSPSVKKLARELGIAGAPTGDLGRRMAGGGIIAFSNEGKVEDPEMSDEERAEYIKNNEYLQRSRAVKEALSPFGQLRNYDPIQKIGDLSSMIGRGIKRFVNESPEDQAKRFRSYSNRKEQAANPETYVPAVKTATQREEAAKAADEKVLADAAGQSSKIDYNRAAQLLKDAKGDVSAAARSDVGAGAGAGAGAGDSGRSPYGLKGTMTGIGDAFKEVQGLLGTDKPNEQLQAYRNLIAGKQEGLGLRAQQMDRNAMAMGFLKFASDPRGFGSGAVEGFKDYLMGSASNKKEMDKIELDFAKIQADLTKAEREEAKGNFELAEKLFDNVQKRTNERLQASKPSEFDRMYSVYAAGEKAAGRTPTFEGFRRAHSGADEDLTRLVKADAAIKVVKDSVDYMRLAASKKPEDQQKAADMIANVYRRYNIDPATGMPSGSAQTTGGSGGTTLRFDASGKQIS